MTIQEEMLPRKWAEMVMYAPEEHSKAEKAAAEFILSTTENLPTMEDVEWNHDKHYLSGAIDSEGNEVIMLGEELGNIRTLDVDMMDSELIAVLESPASLTPNGKKYKMVEATFSSNEKVARNQQQHPEILDTVQDFKDVPNGTIVAGKGQGNHPFVKQGDFWLSVAFNYDVSSLAMAGNKNSTFYVLRRGWGDEQEN